MKIRDKLKNSQMRLVELATYLGISRPTLYKYLELYENKDYNEIDKKCFDLFSFIDKNKNIQRHVIMDYLINKVIPIQEASESEIEVISMVRKLSDSSNEIDRKKFQLIGQIVASDKYDDVLDTLIKLSNESSRLKLEKIEKIKETGEN